jgi:hypothetical protein
MTTTVAAPLTPTGDAIQPAARPVAPIVAGGQHRRPLGAPRQVAAVRSTAAPALGQHGRPFERRPAPRPRDLRRLGKAHGPPSSPCTGTARLQRRHMDIPFTELAPHRDRAPAKARAAPPVVRAPRSRGRRARSRWLLPGAPPRAPLGWTTAGRPRHRKWRQLALPDRVDDVPAPSRQQNRSSSSPLTWTASRTRWSRSARCTRAPRSLDCVRSRRPGGTVDTRALRPSPVLCRKGASAA